jgi:hypothetical protein
MNQSGICFEVNLESVDEARTLAVDVRNQGGSAEITEEPGLLPLPVLLAVVIPPGIALLAIVMDRIVHNWRGRGVLIDARGDGPPRISKEADLPYGTVVILTRKGDESHRSDLPTEKLGEYLAQSIGALNGGASAPEADTTAAASLEP